jgi:DNA gyrase/topoisomerase IV subunit A
MGSSGIAVGFALVVLNRNIKDIIDASIKTINGKEYNAY